MGSSSPSWPVYKEKLSVAEDVMIPDEAMTSASEPGPSSAADDIPCIIQQAHCQTFQSRLRHISHNLQELLFCIPLLKRIAILQNTGTLISESMKSCRDSPLLSKGLWLRHVWSTTSNKLEALGFFKIPCNLVSCTKIDDYERSCIIDDQELAM